MSISRTESRRRSAAASARSASRETSGWVDRIVAGFGSPDPRRREAAVADVVRDTAPNPGPYHFEDRALEAFRAELGPYGRLERSPEAHLAMARVLVDRAASHEEAGREIWAAVALARDLARSDRPEDRARAQYVNEQASLLFSAMGDAYQAEARWQVARYYSVAGERRLPTLGVYRARPAAGHPETSGRRQPAMSARRDPPDPPRELGRKFRDGGPDLPPAMEGRPVGALGLVELANKVAPYVRMCRLAREVARYIARVQAEVRGRTFYPPPPRPSEVRAIRRMVEEGFASPAGTRERHVATEVLRSVDFNLLEESAVAFWGER